MDIPDRVIKTAPKAKIPLTRYAEAACVMHHQTKMEIHVNE